MFYTHCSSTKTKNEYLSRFGSQTQEIPNKYYLTKVLLEYLHEMNDRKRGGPDLEHYWGCFVEQETLYRYETLGIPDIYKYPKVVSESL